MYYESTRGTSKANSRQAVLQGIAPDGGLYIDKNLAERAFDWKKCLTMKPLEMAEMLLKHMLPDFEGMDKIVKKAYDGKFSSPQLTPLVKVGDQYVLELFHGPTCAFKDVALSILPLLISAAREQENISGQTVILTATSGDTGKAALEGFHDTDGTKIIVFYPADGVSPIQKAQMVSQCGNNVKVCAVHGNFDDCQAGVKEAFSEINSSGFAADRGIRLSSANSINIGRLAPQLVYYFIAYSALVNEGRIAIGDTVDFSVPTGNFGNILAGYLAKLMGLPVGKLICASNANNVLTDFIKTGVYNRHRKFIKTSSPSMDILVSSNLERLLYYVSEGDCKFVSECMQSLSSWGEFRVGLDILLEIQDSFSAYYADEEKTAQTIKRLWTDNSYLCDPHTAVAFSAAEEYKEKESDGAPLVILSTASPYKFPETVLSALGQSTDRSEFELMEKLSQLSGIPAPQVLCSLRGKKALHNDIIDRKEIKDYVYTILKQWEKEK